MHNNKEIIVQVTDHPALTIYEQLGGKRFGQMTGARDFMTADNPQPRLLFKLPRNKAGVGTTMEISLLPNDTYLMVFFKMGRGAKRFERKILDRADGIYADQLRSVFERMTGLFTSLA
jgi:hypothetical protein